MGAIDKDYSQMTDEELYEISLKKDRKGRYTREADRAYMERQRRSGVIKYAGVAPKCSKYQSDIDYYGYAEVSNR